VLLFSVSWPWEVLQSVVMTLNVANGRVSLAVRIVCAENPVITAPSIPIVARVKSAVMAETVCRIVLQVRIGLGVPLSAVYSERSSFSQSFFPSWLVSFVRVARTTAIVPMGPSSYLNQQLSKRSCRPVPTCRPCPANQCSITLHQDLRRQIITSLHRQITTSYLHRRIIQVILSNQPIILLLQYKASLLRLPHSGTISLVSKSEPRNSVNKRREFAKFCSVNF